MTYPAGFDVMLIGALLLPGLRAPPVALPVHGRGCPARRRCVVRRHHPPVGGRPQSILLAVAVELSLASACVWLSYHTPAAAERRIVPLLRHRRHQKQKATQLT